MMTFAPSPSPAPPPPRHTHTCHCPTSPNLHSGALTTHTCIHTHTFTHTHIHMHTYTHTHTQTHTYSHTHARAHAHTHMHTHTHTNTHTHTHTHTNTHATTTVETCDPHKVAVTPNYKYYVGGWQVGGGGGGNIVLEITSCSNQIIDAFLFFIFFTLGKYAIMLAVLGRCRIGIFQTVHDGDLCGALTFLLGSVAGPFARW